MKYASIEVTKTDSGLNFSWCGDKHLPIEIADECFFVHLMPFRLLLVRKQYHRRVGIYVRGDYWLSYLTYAFMKLSIALEFCFYEFMYYANKAGLAKTPFGAIPSWSDFFKK